MSPTAISGPQATYDFSWLVLRARLRLELKVPAFARGGSGRSTMLALHARGFKGRTRAEALLWLDREIAARMPGHSPHPTAAHRGTEPTS